jgi:hypothetical protein
MHRHTLGFGLKTYHAVQGPEFYGLHVEYAYTDKGAQSAKDLLYRQHDKCSEKGNEIFASLTYHTYCLTRDVAFTRE